MIDALGMHTKPGAADDDILEDATLVEHLEHTQAALAHLKIRAEHTRAAEDEINRTKEVYGAVGVRGATIYLLLKDLSKVRWRRC